MLERLARALNEILHPSMLAAVRRRDNPTAGRGDIVGAVTSSTSAGRSISPGELRALRLHGQLLTGPRAGSVAAAAAHLGGLQAQAAPPAQLAIRARTSGLATADVDRACGTSREVTRTWAMRGTLHMLATRDVRWMTGLLGPVSARRGQRRRAQLGLDDGLCERALAALAVILAGSPPLTRAELVDRLAEEGIQIGLRTQQPPHLLGYAASRGLICRGPDRPGRPSPRGRRRAARAARAAGRQRAGWTAAGAATRTRGPAREASRRTFCWMNGPRTRPRWAARRRWRSWRGATCAATARRPGRISPPGPGCPPRRARAPWTCSPATW